MSRFLILSILLSLCACGLPQPDSRHTMFYETKCSDSIIPDTFVYIQHTDSLIIYLPQYVTIDLECGEMPEKTDSTVIMMVAGAFTGELLEEFCHSNIAGNHVSHGVFYKGYTCRRNNGAFLFYDGKPLFIHSDYNSALQAAAKKGGCGMTQEMMIHDGTIVKHTRPDNNRNLFRALCLINNKIAIADSKDVMKFEDFISSLLAAGATEALYLDMGLGWSYSWYRNPNGTVTEIYPVSTPYATNWITFYR